MTENLLNELKKRKKNVLLLVLSFFSTISIRLFIPDGPSFLWVLVFILIYAAVRQISQIKKEKNAVIASSVLGILYAVMFYLSYTLQRNGRFVLYYKALFYALFLSFFLAYCLSGLLTLLLHREAACTVQRTKAGCLLWLQLTALFIAFWLPYLLACFPGNMNSDFFGEVRQQMGMSPLSNHHPVIHQLMIRICLIIGMKFGGVENGIALFTVLQMIFVAGTFAACICFLINNGIQKIILYGVFFFYAFYIINGFYAVTLYKDVPFSGITLLFMIMLTKELRGDYRDQKTAARVASLTGMILLSFLFCTIRNNGYYAFVIGMVIILFLNIKKCRRLLILFAAVMILVSGYKFILFNVVGAQKSASSEMLALPLQMLARVIKEDDPDLGEEDFVVLSEVIPDYEAFSEDYIPDTIRLLKTNVRSEVFDKAPGRYIKSWIKIGLRYPRTYLDAFLLHTQGFWDPNLNSSSITAFIEQPNDFGIKQNEKFEMLREVLINQYITLSEHSVISVCFSIGFLVMSYLFTFMLLLLKKQKCFFCAVFILASLWMTTADAPSCHYHYVYALVVCIPLFLGCALGLPET